MTPKTLLACLVFTLLTGCATIGQFDNIVSCAKAGDIAVYSSMYGPLGVSSKVREADAKAICAKP